MTTVITANDIDAVLVQWDAGTLSARDVQSWAEARFAVDACEVDNEVTNEVLGHLDCLDMNLVVPADIPVLREALHAATVAEAIHQIEHSYLLLALEDRKRMCEEDAFYARYCESAVPNKPLRSRRSKLRQRR